MEYIQDLTPVPAIAFVSQKRVQPYRRGARVCPYPGRNGFFLIRNNSARNYPMTDIMLHVAADLKGNTLERTLFLHTTRVWILF